MEFKKFSDVKVDKLDISAVQKKYAALLSKLSQAKDGQEAIKIVKEKFAFDDEINTAVQIPQVRHTIDINDKVNSDLNDFYDENIPLIAEAENPFSQALFKCPFRKELEGEFGKHLFELIEINLKTFSPAIVKDLQEENAIGSEYNKLMGQAKGIYKGEEIPITKFDPLMKSLNREERKEGSEGYWGFFAKNEDKLADIYDRLVKVRTRIAKKLGFDNFLQLGYYRLNRTDITISDVEKYCAQVYKTWVPFCQELYKKQEQRLGIKDMKYYDYSLMFKNGNAKPVGTPEDLVADATKMYKEMSPVASKYFNFMTEHGMMDLVAKAGKIPGGYMTYIPGLKSSFIFSNFNGSAGDVDVLTHEFGHSLQGFLASDIVAPSLRSPGYESCEIHSMSMEFFAYPWMQYFFKENEAKYRYGHLLEDIAFIPYGVSVDEFQVFAYTHPEATQEERKAAWRAIEKKYLPQRKYGEDNAFLEKGGYWMRQLHIYVDPLYYIDYTIAQVGAFEFFIKSNEDFKAAFSQYLSFCKLGGKYPYHELMVKGGLEDPMKPSTLPSIIPELKKYLDSIDDSKF